MQIRVQHWGYNYAFLPFFFWDFEIWGGGDIQVLQIFQVLTILKICGYIQVLTKNSSIFRTRWLSF